MSITNPSTRDQTERGLGLSGTAGRALGHSSAGLEQSASPRDQESNDSGYPGAEEILNSGRVGKALKHLIINQRKGLQKMYGETEAELDESLKTPVKKGEEMARKLIMEMGCSDETAIDLTVLTLYDVAILISMS